MARDHVRLHAELGQQAQDGHVGREHRGLGDLGLLDALLHGPQRLFALAALSEQDVGQLLADQFGHDLVGFGEGVGHDLVFLAQVLEHVHVLRTLPGEEEGDLGALRGPAADEQALGLEGRGRLLPDGRLGAQHQGDLLAQTVPGLGGQGEHVLPAGGLEGEVGLVGQAGQGPRDDVLGQRGETVLHGVGVAASEAEGLAAERGRQFGRAAGGGRVQGLLGDGVEGRGPAAGLLGGFLEGDVEVGAAEAEGGDVGAADLPLAVPRARLGVDVERALGPVHAGVGLAVVDAGGQGLVEDRQGGLHEPGGSGRGLEVPDLGFDGPQGDGARGGVLEDLGGGLHFGQVADAGRGAVGLEQADVLGTVVQGLEGALDGELLALRVGGRDALALPVGGGADGADEGVDAVPVLHGVGEPLEDEHAAAFAHDEAVGVGVEGAGAVGGQGPDLGELDVGGGGHHLVHAAGDHHVELAEAQAVDGLGQGAQRRRAGGVHREVGAVEVEDVGDAARDDVGELARHGVFVDRGETGLDGRDRLDRDGLAGALGHVGQGGRVQQFVAEHRGVDPQVAGFLLGAAHGVAEDHGGPGAVEGLLGVAGILEGHGRGADGELVGAVHLVRDRGRDAELEGVEFEIGDEAADLGVGLVRGAHVRVVVEAPVPAVLGDLGDGIHLVDDVLPEGGDVLGSGKHSSETDDRDGFSGVDESCHGYPFPQTRRWGSRAAGLPAARCVDCPFKRAIVAKLRPGVNRKSVSNFRLLI